MGRVRNGRRNHNKNIITSYKGPFIFLFCVILICVCILVGRGVYTQIALKEEQRERNQRLNEIFVADASKENEDEPQVKKDTYLNITALGDILCEEPLYNDAYNAETKEYDFMHFFKNVSKYTKQADLAIGTLETNFIDENYSGYKKYNSPIELAKALQEIGVDVLSLATNHSFDYGQEGLVATKDNLEKLEIETVGTNRNKEETRYVLKEVEGFKIAILSYTYGLNNQNEYDEQSGLVNITNKDRILEDITKAKEEGAEYICTMIHWGDLTSNQANENQKELTDFLVDNGVDLILGNHPAVLQPMEVRKNKEGKDVFIVYSQGNFISASEYKNSSIEMILDIRLRKDGETGEVLLNKVTYVPVFLLDNGRKVAERFELFDMKEAVQKYEAGDKIVSEEVYQNLIQALDEIEVLIGNR